MKKVLLSLIMIGALFSLTGCNKDAKTLKNIVNKLNNLTSYKELKAIGNFKENVNKNVLTIEVNNDFAEETHEFVLKDGFLSVETNENDTYGAILFMELAEAIAEINGMDSDAISPYINGVVTENLKSDYVKHSEENGKTKYSLSVNKFDMEPLLKQMNITEKDLEFFEKFDNEEESTSGFGTKGNFVYYVKGDINESDIIFAERKGFSDRAYSNLLTLIKYFYEKDYNNFVSNYPKLEEKSFGKFTIKYLSNDNEEVKEYFSNFNLKNYKVLQVLYK